MKKRFHVSRKVWYPALLIMVTLLVYMNSFNNGFVWDDELIIVNNPQNRELSNLLDLFRSADIVYSDEPQPPYYRPVNRFTYMLDYQLFGLNPLGYHVENIGLHLIAVLLLFVLVDTLFTNTSVAFLSALIFAVHPINAEAVNFISARNTLLAAVFVLSSFIVYRYAARKQKPLFFYCSGMLFFFGLLCKETALALLPVLFLYDIRRGAPLMEHAGKKILSLLPFMLFLGIYIFLRSNALSNAVGVNMEMEKLWQRIWQDSYIVPAYLSNFLFPLNLNIWYVIPSDYLSHYLALSFQWIIIFLLVLTILKKGTAAMTFGILWFAITFLPVSNIIPIPSAPMADRHVYLSVMGLCITLAAFFCTVLAQTKGLMQKTILSASIILLVLFCLITFKRNVDWRDDFSLARSVVRTDPESAFGHYMLGQLFFKRGDLFNAMKEWEKTVEIQPNDPAALTQLGNVYQVSNSLLKARELYSRAIEANPNHYEAQYNMALISEKLGNTADALMHYEVFLKIVPSRYSWLVPVVEDKISRIKETLRTANKPSPFSHQEASDGVRPEGKK
jgi:hypothetical protein